MPYDDQLAERVRAALASGRPFTEKKMFGGDAFLLDGHMAVAASRSGGLMVRVDPAETTELVTRSGVERMVMSGREMNGWLRVAVAELANDGVLQEWVDRGVAFVATLPAK